MKNLTVENIVSAVGGDWIGKMPLPTGEISFVTTDSREAKEGCLFAAIKGERSDGHDYIKSVLESGALCVICERIPEGLEGAPLIAVKDSVRALGDLAAFYRKGLNVKVVGVTGSVGKTTAKEMISAVLSRKYSVHKTPKNLNNDLGVPLTLFGLNEEHQVAVVEMGISHFGEMRRLGEIVRPDMALYTAIGAAHLEFLGDFEGVLRAKSEMLEYVPNDGMIFVNGDDATLHDMVCSQRLCRYGCGEDCDIRAEKVTVLGTAGTELSIVAGARRIHAGINAFGSHLVTAALGAAAVGMFMHLSDEEIAAGIADYAPVGSRSGIIKTPNITIIDDCYNANPTSMAAALSSLARLEGRRVAILGDMFELGENEYQFHYDTGMKAALSGIDMVISFGNLAEGIFDGASDGGCEIPVHFSEKSMLIDALPTLLKKGDTVLVKASHSMHFEELVEALKEV